MEKSIFQLQISLKGFKPKIWRRFLVPSDMLLSDLHKVIQLTMGWTNSHLHQFKKGKTFYSMKNENDPFPYLGSSKDYKKIRINNLLINEKDTIEYEYDFGDGWEHKIVLEKILPYNKETKLPICLAGKMNCPPEDCGGIYGYMDILEILKNPKHEEYENFIEWLGGDFDPEAFDKDDINEYLVNYKKYFTF